MFDFITLTVREKEQFIIVNERNVTVNNLTLIFNTYLFLFYFI